MNHDLNQQFVICFPREDRKEHILAIVFIFMHFQVISDMIEDIWKKVFFGLSCLSTFYIKDKSSAVSWCSLLNIISLGQ